MPLALAGLSRRAKSWMLLGSLLTVKGFKALKDCSEPFNTAFLSGFGRLPVGIATAQ
jgi:hypothetical protein